MISDQLDGSFARMDWRDLDEDIMLCNKARENGYPNRWGAQILVPSNWNLPPYQELLQNYWDKDVVEWTRFGWPISWIPGWAQPRASK